MWIDRYRTSTQNGPQTIARLRNRVFRNAPQVVWTSLRGETVVFDIERGQYESLNEVATSVWERIVDGATFDSILEALHEEYELPLGTSVDQMTTDVVALIAKLEKARVIVSEPVVASSGA
jgi:Coenzyme PQQ synthesis protein D (PqqD)